ncbi:MAG: hypothetical protein IT567_01130 [Alphaproteobacteria bacterium]|nr:hypothetical protein [Alphaproteobacteria bacterium]
MFSYLRYFSVVSFVVVMVAAVCVGIYFRQIAAGDLKTIVEQGNVSLSQGFINTTWKKHSTLFDELSRVDVPKWARYPAFIEFSRDAFRYFEEIPVTKINVYTTSGKRFLSTNQTEISFFSAENTPQNRTETYREGFQMALKGEVYSRIVPEGQYQALDGTTRTATLVQSFVPIISDRYVSIVADTAPEVEAVIEVFYDVTPQWEQLWLFQVLSTGGIVVIFLILFAALMYTSHKAEGIIAKQHDSNLELTAAKARAEAANREKSKFLANISHELRTPLNAIIGFSEIIKNEMMGDLGNPQYIDYINNIHSSGVHLLSLINDILDYSKAEAGKLELEVSEMDATKLIKTSIRLVSPRAESAEVKLVDQTPKEHFVVNSDAKKFKQVLLNLLSNAVKFTPPRRRGARCCMAERHHRRHHGRGDRHWHRHRAQGYFQGHGSVRAGGQ